MPVNSALLPTLSSATTMSCPSSVSRSSCDSLKLRLEVIHSFIFFCAFPQPFPFFSHPVEKCAYYCKKLYTEQAHDHMARIVGDKQMDRLIGLLESHGGKVRTV